MARGRIAENSSGKCTAWKMTTRDAQDLNGKPAGEDWKEVSLETENWRQICWTVLKAEKPRGGRRRRSDIRTSYTRTSRKSIFIISVWETRENYVLWRACSRYIYIIHNIQRSRGPTKRRCALASARIAYFGVIITLRNKSRVQDDCQKTEKRAAQS